MKEEIISLILSIIVLITLFIVSLNNLFMYVGLPLSILAIIFGILALKQRTPKIRWVTYLGIILGFFGLFMWVRAFIILPLLWFGHLPF